MIEYAGRYLDDADSPSISPAKAITSDSPAVWFSRAASTTRAKDTCFSREAATTPRSGHCRSPLTANTCRQSEEPALVGEGSSSSNCYPLACGRSPRSPGYAAHPARPPALLGGGLESGEGESGGSQQQPFPTARAAQADFPVRRHEHEPPSDGESSKSEAWRGLLALSQWANTSWPPQPPPGPPPPGPPQQHCVPESFRLKSWNELDAAQVGGSSKRPEDELEEGAHVAEAGQQRDPASAREVVQRYRNWTSDAD